MDISQLINAVTWNMLSSDSRAFLSTLLPPTAFSDYQPSIGPDHPSPSSAAHVDQETTFTSPRSSTTLDVSVFADPHFLAAAHTFQDHIYSNWRSDVHVDKVQRYEKGVCDGSLSAPWKDEVWEKDNSSTKLLDRKYPSSRGEIPESSARAGSAAEVKLIHLAKNAVVLVGDVIAYKRHFANLGIVVEKDVIIQSIHPKTHALTVLVETGPTQHLPERLLLSNPPEPTAPTLEMTITSPTMLESGLLDVDGRVDKSSRPNGNAWKSFTVWRWRVPISVKQDIRAGRENHGTLFYLRGCYYHDR